ncbi:MAG: glutaredoxin family protein [Solirubrobacteraceae bacterium]
MAPHAGGGAGERPPRTITIYLHNDCHLCAEALRVLAPIAAEHGARICERDIHADEGLLRAYLERVPVIELDGEELCEFVVDEPLLRARLAAH